MTLPRPIAWAILIGWTLAGTVDVLVGDRIERWRARL